MIIALLLLGVVFCRPVDENYTSSPNDFLVPERVFLFDHTPYSFLFRGNAPLTSAPLCDMSQSFNKTGLDSVLKCRCAEQGFRLSSRYFLFDISLVNPDTSCPDLHDLTIEKEYAANHSDIMELWNLVLLGDEDNPWILTDEERLAKV